MQRPTASPPRPPAIVFGVDEQMALGLLAALGRAGVEVVGLSHLPDAVGFLSRHCSEAKVCPSIFDRQDDLLKFFLESVPRGVIVPSYDPFPGFLCRHRAVLAEAGFRLLVPEYDRYSAVSDKGQLAIGAADDPDLPVPTSFVVEGDAVGALRSRVPFPCVLKVGHPWCKDNRIVHSASELESGYRSLVERIHSKGITGYRVLAQRWVPGDEIVHISQLVDAEGRQASCMIARRLRVNRSADGSEHDATLLEKIDEPELAERARRFAVRHGLRGLMELECKLEDGRPPALLDVNPRIWAWHSFAERNGVDYALGYYKLCLGEAWTATPRPDGPSLHWRLLASTPSSSDVHATIRLWQLGRLSFGQAVRSLASLAWKVIRRPGGISLDFGERGDLRPRVSIVARMFRDAFRYLLGKS